MEQSTIDIENGFYLNVWCYNAVGQWKFLIKKTIVPGTCSGPIIHIGQVHTKSMYDLSTTPTTPNPYFVIFGFYRQ